MQLGLLFLLNEAQLRNIGAQFHDARLQLHIALAVGRRKHGALGVEVDDFHCVAGL